MWFLLFAVDGRSGSDSDSESTSGEGVFDKFVGEWERVVRSEETLCCGLER